MAVAVVGEIGRGESDYDRRSSDHVSIIGVVEKQETQHRDNEHKRGGMRFTNKKGHTHTHKEQRGRSKLSLKEVLHYCCNC